MVQPRATPLTETIHDRGGLLFVAWSPVRGSADRREIVPARQREKPQQCRPVVDFCGRRIGEIPPVAPQKFAENAKRAACVSARFVHISPQLRALVGVAKNQFAVKVIMVCEARGQKLHNPLPGCDVRFPGMSHFTPFR